MSGHTPPIPPRPDLGEPARLAWRFVDPGRMKAPAIVGAGIRLWAESWWRWFVVSLVFSGLATIAVAALDPWTATYGDRSGPTSEASFLESPMASLSR